MVFWLQRCPLKANHMQCNWIWIGGQAHDNQATVFFRRSFSLAAAPDAAVIHLSAAHIFELYVNGRYIARGPHRADPRYPYFHSFDVADDLRAGVNHVVCVVHHFVRPEGVLRRWNLYGGEAGLAAEIVLPDQSLVTDDQWQAAAAPGWRDTAQTGHRFHPPIHQVDVATFTAARDAALTGEDNLSWAPAVASDVVATPLPAEAPPHDDVLHEAISIESVHNTYEQINPATKSMMRGAPELYPAVEPTNEGAWLIFRLPYIMAGTYSLTMRCDETAQLDVYCGEGAEKHICDKLTIRGECTFVPLDWRGGDCVAVHIAQSTSPVTLKAFSFIERRYPYPYEGDFSCSDETINQTWQITRRTIHQGTQDHLVDCVWREQALWIEDVCIHAQAIRAAFGDMKPVVKSVRQALRTMDERGIVAVPGPSGGSYGFERDPLPWAGQMLTLPMTVQVCFDYDADVAFAHWCIERFEKMLAYFHRYADGRGLLNTDTEGLQGIYSFGGWGYQLSTGVSATLNSQYAIALAAAAGVARHIGRNDVADDWLQRSERATAAMRELFWDAQRCVVVDGEADGEVKRGVSLTTNAWAALAGVVPHAYGGAWAEALRTMPQVFPIASPYDASTLLKAYAKLDLELHLRETLDGYYGSIARAGHKTLPEFWMQHDPDMAGMSQDSSRCHAYGAGPTFVAHEYLLGVTAVEPGYTKLRIAPRCAGLIRASGRIPTPAGSVSVAWQRSDARWELTVELPVGVTAEVELPHQSWDRQCLYVNGRRVWSAPRWDDILAQMRREEVSDARRVVQHQLTAPGRHVLELSVH